MSMTVKRKSELLGRPYTRILADHELALARLYDCLGSTLTRASEFWRKMAQEEIDHRDIIHHIEEKMDECGWEFELPAFRYKDVSDAIEWIGIIRKRMTDDGVTMNKALEVAISIEQGILESGFFEVVNVKDDEVKQAMEDLTKYTESHLEYVKKEAKKLKWKFLGDKK